MLSFGHVSQEDITILRVAWPGATERPLACWLSPGPTSLFPLHTISTSTHWTTFLCLFSCSCVRMLFPFSCKCLLYGWWSSDASSEVNAVGQWEPISCGEPTSVQGSVVDNKEFVFHVIAASECRTGCMMSADTVKFALSLSVVLVLVYGITDGYIITVGSKRFLVGSPSWMDGPKTSVEESPVDSICSVQVKLICVLLRLWCHFRLQPGARNLLPVRRSIISFSLRCGHALRLQCLATMTSDTGKTR